MEDIPPMRGGASDIGAIVCKGVCTRECRTRILLKTRIWGGLPWGCWVWSGVGDTKHTASSARTRSHSWWASSDKTALLLHACTLDFWGDAGGVVGGYTLPLPLRKKPHPTITSDQTPDSKSIKSKCTVQAVVSFAITVFGFRPQPGESSTQCK